MTLLEVMQNENECDLHIWTFCILPDAAFVGGFAGRLPRGWWAAPRAAPGRAFERLVWCCRVKGAFGRFRAPLVEARAPPALLPWPADTIRSDLEQGLSLAQLAWAAYKPLLMLVMATAARKYFLNEGDFCFCIILL